MRHVVKRVAFIFLYPSKKSPKQHNVSTNQCTITNSTREKDPHKHKQRKREKRFQATQTKNIKNSRIFVVPFSGKQVNNIQN